MSTILKPNAWVTFSRTIKGQRHETKNVPVRIQAVDATDRAAEWGASFTSKVMVDANVKLNGKPLQENDQMELDDLGDGSVQLKHPIPRRGQLRRTIFYFTEAQ